MKKEKTIIKTTKRRCKQMLLTTSIFIMSTLPVFAASVDFLNSPTTKFQKYALGAAFFVIIVVLCVDGFILLTDKKEGSAKVKKAIPAEIIGCGLITFVPQLVLIVKDIFGV